MLACRRTGYLPRVTQGQALARQAAELAASQDQPVVEVVALYTAVCFGDRTVADRLTELITPVDEPRAPAAAPLAAGVCPTTRSPTG